MRPAQDQAGEDKKTGADSKVDSGRVGVSIKIPLPVDSKSAARIRLTLKQIVDKAPQVVRPKDRQAVVFEFDTAGGKTGRGSELEACQSLARYLGSPELNRIETIAYIPTDPRNEEGLTGQLSSHAVLIAIACNQLAMDRGSAIGNAGIDEPDIDPLLRAVYSSIAAQRLTLPIPVVMAMLEKDQQLYDVRTADGNVFVNSPEMDKLERSGEAIETDTITQKDEMALLTSQQLSDFRLLRYHVSSRNELNRELGLALHSLDRSPAVDGTWRAVQVELPPYIDERTTRWITRSLTQQFGSKHDPNLVIFNIDSNEGDVDACLSLARYLVDLDNDRVQTVAFIRETARGSVGLLALSCDQVVMATDARLGGHPEVPEELKLEPEALDELKPMVKALARDKQQDWSLMMAMIDPRVTVTRFRHKTSRQLRLLSEQELRLQDEPDDWAPLGPVDVEEGLTATTAEQVYVARAIADDSDQLKVLYGLEDSPPVLRPSAADRWIERAALFLSTPTATLILLFGAMFFLSTEMSAPGLGVPGFLSVMCFMLFFWSQHLGGNAHWLEIMMFSTLR